MYLEQSMTRIYQRVSGEGHSVKVFIDDRGLLRMSIPGVMEDVICPPGRELIIECVAMRGAEPVGFSVVVGRMR